MLSTIRSQLIALVLLTLLAVLLVGGAGLYAQSRLTAALADAEGAGVAMRNHMQSDMLHDNLRGLVEQYSGAVRDNDPVRIQDAVKELTINSKSIQEEYVKNESVNTLPESVRIEIKRVEPIVKAYALSAQAVAQGATNDPAGLEKSRADFTTKFKVLEKELGDIRDKIEAAVRDAKESGADIAKFATSLTIGMMILAAFSVVTVGVFFYGKLSANLKKITRTIADVNSGQMDARTQLKEANELGDLGRSFDALLDDRIASLEKNGKENEALNNSVIGLLQTVFQLGSRDLTARAPVSEDIIGTVSSSINQLSEETGNTLLGIRQIAEQVLRASESVRAQAQVVDATAEQGEQSLRSMASSLTLATQQLVQVAQLSSQSGEIASKTSEATQSALHTVGTTVSGMSQLSTRMAEMENRFKQLAERTKEITTAVGLVNALTERTNLLALSASTQAAAAGEAGRGFMVVAQEVRRLSDSSQTATAQISQLVTNIQNETNETLTIMGRLMTSVNQQTVNAQKAGEGMAQSQTATTELVEMVQRIAAFAQQQTKIAAQLQTDLSAMRVGTEKTVEASAAQSSSADTLVNYSRRLTESVGLFKLGNSA